MPEVATSTEPVSATPPSTADAPAAKPKKICCACPETRKVRDECVTHNGEDACAESIEKHKLCLRAEGFNVRAAHPPDFCLVVSPALPHSPYRFDADDTCAAAPWPDADAARLANILMLRMLQESASV